MKCKEGLGQNYLSMECRCTVLTAKVLGTTELHVKKSWLTAPGAEQRAVKYSRRNPRP
jgi:hypothetical protein